MIKMLVTASLLFVLQAPGQTIGQTCTSRDHNGITQWVKPTTSGVFPGNPSRDLVCASLWDGENRTNWYVTINGMTNSQPLVFKSANEATQFILNTRISGPLTKK